jgi:hypothetical protein
MKVVEGEVGVVGHGTWSDGGGGGKTILSVLEIGDTHLKPIVLPDYLSNYLNPGQQVRVLVGQGLSHGLITRPFVAAVESNGKKYKIDSVLTMVVLKSILYCFPALLLAAIHPILAVAACVAIFMFYTKEYLDLKRF